MPGLGAGQARLDCSTHWHTCRLSWGLGHARPVLTTHWHEQELGQGAGQVGLQQPPVHMKAGVGSRSDWARLLHLPIRDGTGAGWAELGHSIY